MHVTEDYWNYYLYTSNRLVIFVVRFAAARARFLVALDALLANLRARKFSSFINRQYTLLKTGAHGFSMRLAVV